MAEDKIENKKDFLLNESFITGQLKVISIIESLLQESQLDVLLNINKNIEEYTYDICTMYVRTMFGSRYDDDAYFNSLCIFIQKFILCAASQAHHEDYDSSTSNDEENKSESDDQE
eukprot:926538_1